MGTATPELVRKLAHAAEGLTGIPADRVLGKGRRADVALVRQMLMFLIRESCAATWQHTGELFQRDHGTVIYAHKKVVAMIKIEANASNQHTAALVRAIAEACDLETPASAALPKPGL